MRNMVRRSGSKVPKNMNVNDTPQANMRRRALTRRRKLDMQLSHRRRREAAAVMTSCLIFLLTHRIPRIRYGFDALVDSGSGVWCD